MEVMEAERIGRTCAVPTQVRPKAWQVPSRCHYAQVGHMGV